MVRRSHPGVAWPCHHAPRRIRSLDRLNVCGISALAAVARRHGMARAAALRRRDGWPCELARNQRPCRAVPTRRLTPQRCSADRSLRRRSARARARARPALACMRVPGHPPPPHTHTRTHAHAHAHTHVPDSGMRARVRFELDRRTSQHRTALTAAAHAPNGHGRSQAEPLDPKALNPESPKPLNPKTLRP